MTFQDLILKLSAFWASQGCIIQQPLDLEVGAGTSHPETLLRVLGTKPWSVAYVQPSRRPDDGRFGQNPNRVFKHHQFQVILKPSPDEVQQIYLQSLEAMGIEPRQHDIRFEEDNWESPTLGAWGIGWQVLFDGMEITQFTYFQQVGGINLAPISAELTYGLERIAMILQKVDNIFDLEWGGGVKYSEVRLREEVEQSKYVFGQVEGVSREEFAAFHRDLFDRYYGFSEKLLKSGLILPSLEYCLKCSHLFNILDSSSSVGVTERTAYVLKVRQLAVAIAQAYVAEPAGEKRGLTPFNMERELLLEIGTEELPASWLPSLTRQIREGLDAALKAHRLLPDAPVESYSTPRRLTARIDKIAERQTDLDELLTGPPVAAAFGPDGQPTPAAIGFAKKNGTDVALLEKVDTPKGVYLGYRKHQRGKAAVDILPAVLAATLRSFNFPKAMRWDAHLEDGKGDLLFGRPIRWILFLYGGRVVPFTIRRTELAESALVQEVVSAAFTYGHRFLTTSGRAGRAVKVRSFEEYRDRLAEHFVVLDRQERHDRIARGLEAKARSLGGRVAPAASHHSTLLEEVPDLIEYPTVIAGTFAAEFLALPEEILTTTMIHHQHNFPVVDDRGHLKAAFLAVTNTDAANEKIVSRNYERVLTARLRDARFFWDADRQVKLVDRLPRLATIRFHKKLGTYQEKAERLEKLARWIASEPLASPGTADAAARAGKLAKADLATEMVGELTELQGVMGGIYAREEGEPEEVWKAIYHHYLPDSVGVDAPPSSQQLAGAAVTWAAVSLADKLDTLAGMFYAGERPTGSRDPFGLRRQAHGLFKILVDLPALTGLKVRPTLGQVLTEAMLAFAPLDEWPPDARDAMLAFLLERYRYVLEQRGFDVRNVRAVLQAANFANLNPADALARLEALPEFTESADFRKLAVAFKRVKNMARELTDADDAVVQGLSPVPQEKVVHGLSPVPQEKVVQGLSPVSQETKALLKEPAEIALLQELEQRAPVIDSVLKSGENLRRAFVEAAQFGPAVDRFFTEIFVMVEDPALRKARLRLMKLLERLILRIADISEIVSETE